jgi:hypothetical protein
MENNSTQENPILNGSESSNSLDEDISNAILSKRYNIALMFLAFFATIALKVAFIPHDDIIGYSDEALYINMAQNLAHHGILSHPPPELAIKLIPPRTPPLYSIMLIPAALLDVKPLDREFYFYLNNVILGSLAVFPLFWIASFYRVRNKLMAVLFASLSVPLTAYVFVGFSENLYTTVFLYVLAAYVYYFKRPNLWRGVLFSLSLIALVLTRKAGLFALPPVLLGLLFYFSDEGRIRITPIFKIAKRSLVLIPPLLAHNWSLSYMTTKQSVSSYTTLILDRMMDTEGALLHSIEITIRPIIGQYGYLFIWTSGIVLLGIWSVWRTNRDRTLEFVPSGEPSTQTRERLLAPAVMLTLLTVGITAGGVLHCIKGNLAELLPGGKVDGAYSMYARYADPSMPIVWLFVAVILLGTSFPAAIKKRKVEAIAVGIITIPISIGIVMFVLHFWPVRVVFSDVVQAGLISKETSLRLFSACIILNVFCCFFKYTRWLPLLCLLVWGYYQMGTNDRGYRMRDRDRIVIGAEERMNFYTQALAVQEFDGKVPIYMLSRGKASWYDHGLVLNTFFDQVTGVLSVKELLEKNPRHLFYAPQHQKFYRVGELMEQMGTGELDLIGAFGVYDPRGNAYWKMEPRSKRIADVFRPYRDSVTAQMPRPHPKATVWTFTLAPRTTLYQEIRLPFEVTPGGIGRGAARFFWSEDADWTGLEIGILGGNAKVSDFKKGTFSSVGKVTSKPRKITVSHEFTSTHKTLRFAIRNTSDAPLTFRVGKPEMYYKPLVMKTGRSVPVDKLTRVIETNPVIPLNSDRAYISKTPLHVTFVIEEAGTYQLEGLFHGIGGDNDSYWLETEFGDRSRKTWHTPRQPLDWAWAEAPEKWALKPGEYQFKLIPREETPLAAIRINLIPEESP